MSDKLFCPPFIYEICIGITVKEFLVKAMSLEMVSKNYADAITKHYNNVEEILVPNLPLGGIEGEKFDGVKKDFKE